MGVPDVRFRKKPVVIEARKVGDPPYKVLAVWCGGNVIRDSSGKPVAIEIPTLEGVMMAQRGDWVIKGIAGEFYPCKPNIFEATYEAVTE